MLIDPHLTKKKQPSPNKELLEVWPASFEVSGLARGMTCGPDCLAFKVFVNLINNTSTESFHRPYVARKWTCPRLPHELLEPQKDHDFARRRGLVSLEIL